MVRHNRDMADGKMAEGDYDTALHYLDEIPEADLSDFWREAYSTLRHHIELRRTGDRHAFERARETIAFFDDETDPQLRSGVDVQKCDLLRDVGDWAAVYDVAMGIDPEYTLAGTWFACNAAAWLGDPSKLEPIAAILSAHPDPFPDSIEYLEATRLALEGRADEATAAFVSVIDGWTVRILPAELAQARATFALLLGADNAAAAQAARDAHDWLVETGSRSLLAAWARALPMGDAATATG
jgi:hypothetical protein